MGVVKNLEPNIPPNAWDIIILYCGYYKYIQICIYIKIPNRDPKVLEMAIQVYITLVMFFGQPCHMMPEAKAPPRSSTGPTS